MLSWVHLCFVGVSLSGPAAIAQDPRAQAAAVSTDPARASHPDYGGKAYNPSLMPELAVNFKGSTGRFAVGDNEPDRQAGTYRNGGVAEQKIPYGISPTAPASKVDFKPDVSKEIVAWYEYDVHLADKDKWTGGLLDIEGSYYETEVFVNEKYVGRHVGIDPFSFDVSAYLNNSGQRVNDGTRHKITLRVKSDPKDRTHVSGKQEKFPNEGSIFYKIMHGPWQGMQLRRINPAGYIDELYALGELNGKLTIEAVAKGGLAAEATLAVKAIDPVTGEIVGNGIGRSQNGRFLVEMDIGLPKLWTPDNPNHYRFEAYLDAGGRPIERMRSYVLFRSLQKDTFLFLNKRLFTLKGSLKQGYWVNTYYTAGPGIFERDAINLMQAGYNMIRGHQNTLTYQQMELLDTGIEFVDIVTKKKVRKGMLYSLEMPSLRDMTSPTVQRAYFGQLFSLFKQKGWRSNFLYWLNETWGALDDHGVRRSITFLQALQRKGRGVILDALPKFGRAKSPLDKLIPENSGWEQGSAFDEAGNVKPGHDPSEYLMTIHDYFGADVPSWKYGQITLESMKPGSPFPDPNPHHKAFLPGSGYGGLREVPILDEWNGVSNFRPEYRDNAFGYNEVPFQFEKFIETKKELYKVFLRYMEIFRFNRVDTQDINTDQEGNGDFDEHGRPKMSIHDIRLFNDTVEEAAQALFYRTIKAHPEVKCNLMTKGVWSGVLRQGLTIK